jgi:energy-coupling factor transporter ATP-binding protein EcfA2
VTVERQSWQEHLAHIKAKHDAGQHVFIAGPTGSGKSEMALALTDYDRPNMHVVNFVTKPTDDTFSGERIGHWDRIEEWNPKRGKPSPHMDRVLLWPKPLPTMEETKRRQRMVFHDALNSIYRTGRWRVVIDELHYLSDPAYLGLGSDIAAMHHFGRSLNVTMISLTQRPAWVPKIIYSSVDHAYIARTVDVDDLKRLSDFGGINSRELAEAVKNLPTKHDFVYVNPRGDHPPVIVNSHE